MDADRFDAAARSLVHETTQRRTLGGLLVGGTLALLGLAQPEDAWAGSRGCKRCNSACERCVRGNCHKNNRGQKVCKRGRCRRKPPGTPCVKDIGTVGLCQFDGSCCRPSTAPCTDVCLPNSFCTTCCSGVCFANGLC
jgi:hypothetical protein